MELGQFASYLVTEGTTSGPLSSLFSAGMSFAENRWNVSSFLLGSSLASSKETKGKS